jgi:hypothetical protein
MTIKAKAQQTTIEIDLTGPEGNAYHLLNVAKRLANAIGLDADAVLTEMKSSDYENLVQVFDKHFGTCVTLYR